MVFGSLVSAASSVAPAQWLIATRRGASGTVGGLVPNDFDAFARLWPPAPSADWWEAYRAVHALVAAIGAEHTTTADRVWLAVWEGHGWENTTTHIGVRGEMDPTTRMRLQSERARLREEDARRRERIRVGLAGVPRFEAPHRRYYLLAGAVTAGTMLEQPGTPGTWQRPDLLWPDDRAWFVATDVDFWSLYVGGTRQFVAELLDNAPVRAELVGLGDRLGTED